MTLTQSALIGAVGYVLLFIATADGEYFMDMLGF